MTAGIGDKSISYEIAGQYCLPPVSYKTVSYKTSESVIDVYWPVLHHWTFFDRPKPTAYVLHTVQKVVKSFVLRPTCCLG